jgi:hypothetical protein
MRSKRSSVRRQEGGQGFTAGSLVRHAGDQLPARALEREKLSSLLRIAGRIGCLQAGQG